MFQIDEPSAVPSLPAPAAAGTQGYFSNGNPGTGLPATVVDADFLNMMMMELTNVVTAAGLTPSKTTYNQVVQAIRILVGTGSANYGSDSGTINAYAATFPAPVLSVTDGLVLAFNAAHANTGASTFTPNSGTVAPKPIWGGNLAALSGGEIVVGYTRLEWNAVYGAWILLDSAGGAQQLGGGSYIPDAPALDRSSKVASTRWTLRNVFRVGEVKMYHGSVASIASVWGPGWQLADGTNGTANLKDQFIVGAGASYAPNAQGGLNTNVLTVAQLPPHSHAINISDPGHAHSIADGGHSHGVSQSPHAHGVSDPGHAHGWSDGTSQVYSYGPGGSGLSGGTTWNRGTTMQPATTGIGIQAQNANLSINAATTGLGIYAAGTGITATSNNTGSGAAVENRPPYYALCFIEYTGIGA
ncbi:hypothetical protein [Paraburkholderia sp. BR14320]|uniref:hypothetical protein n=1 Tax=unclassified Paraburkholderia TaxID=2615204 RepID=UPI0034CFB0E1